MRNAIAAALQQHWGITGELTELDRGSTARAWRVDTTNHGPLVARLTPFPVEHVELGLRVAERVDRDVIPAGAPVRTMIGELTVDVGGERLALLRFVPGRPLTVEDVDVAALARLLAQVHVAIADIDPAGAWTIDTDVAYIRAGMRDAQPAWVRDFVLPTLDAVEAWQPGREQVLRRDGFAVHVDDRQYVGLIDWGASMYGSVAVDIGIWTVHLGSIAGEYTQVLRTFIDGYREIAPLTEHEEAAIPLFQQLRLADRFPGITDPDHLARLRKWVEAWSASVGRAR
jgi:Ser/Thr protein kinase RdoA (MazF antagonist)